MKYWVDLREKEFEFPFLHSLIDGFIINDLSFESFPKELNTLIYIEENPNILNLERTVSALFQKYEKTIIVELPYSLDNCYIVQNYQGILKFCMRVDNFIEMNNGIEVGCSYVYLDKPFYYPDAYNVFAVINYSNIDKSAPTNIVKIKPNEFKEMFNEEKSCDNN